ncbi:DUF6508 domain-containing protein [Streptomyces sp. TRM 70361]|uniref:DUF6508 domain-containing protein n=1 Tax=Streptomyces sp. TRM 70361 TaxID=3116553 RepID=UPI002E7B0B4C|nr:DUF6508 domain-containing protein [Streptomyces sp. TRM 70361]MEE1941014.1 DUF6508 domain-containing protein [Streptomyces sp. TRM 70361]
MNDNGDPDDAVLLAQLDTTPGRADAWERLLAAADEFASRPHVEDDVRWEMPRRQPDGSMSFGYPVYGERVERARRALSEVGAVTPAYHWTRYVPPRLPDDGSPPSPADAMRLATHIVRGERFGDGHIGKALEHGTLQAALASLAAWYRDRSRG